MHHASLKNLFPLWFVVTSTEYKVDPDIKYKRAGQESATNIQMHHPSLKASLSPDKIIDLL